MFLVFSKIPPSIALLINPIPMNNEIIPKKLVSASVVVLLESVINFVPSLFSFVKSTLHTTRSIIAIAKKHIQNIPAMFIFVMDKVRIAKLCFINMK